MTMKQRASERLWDIIATRANPIPVKAVSSSAVYTPQYHEDSVEKKASKESGGIPTVSLDAAGRRKRSRILRWGRQTGV